MQVPADGARTELSRVRSLLERVTLRKRPEVVLSEEQYARYRLRESSTGFARGVGLILLALSAGLLLAAYATSSMIIEASSIASFAFGLAILLSEMEPRVKLYPANESIRGPMVSFARIVRSSIGEFTTVYSASGGEMKLIPKSGKSKEIPTSSVGESLVRDYVRELGKIDRVGVQELSIWLPKMIESLGLAGKVRVVESDGKFVTTLVRPYVRTLCVDQEMSKEVCPCIGCPLVGSIGESLARATGQAISHVSCTFDPKTQTAMAVHAKTWGEEK